MVSNKSETMPKPCASVSGKILKACIISHTGKFHTIKEQIWLTIWLFLLSMDTFGNVYLRKLNVTLMEQKSICHRMEYKHLRIYKQKTIQVSRLKSSSSEGIHATT
jgi:hypothetical protein